MYKDTGKRDILAQYEYWILRYTAPPFQPLLKSREDKYRIICYSHILARPELHSEVEWKTRVPCFSFCHIRTQPELQSEMEWIQRLPCFFLSHSCTPKFTLRAGAKNTIALFLSLTFVHNKSHTQGWSEKPDCLLFSVTFVHSQSYSQGWSERHVCLVLSFFNNSFSITYVICLPWKVK
jgi:hypothetical protein